MGPKRASDDNTASSRKAKGKGIVTNQEEGSPVKTKKQLQAEKRREEMCSGGPGKDEIYAKLLEMRFDQTKFVDADVLSQLGIYGDVKTIFNNMGLARFMSMKEPANKSITYQFLSTLGVHHFDPTRNHANFAKYGRGYISFELGQKLIEVTFTELCAIFGFEVENTSSDQHFVYPVGELNRIWETIASGDYEPGASKIAAIRNPAIRYAAKALIHIFYAKIEADTLWSEDLEFLGVGLKPLFPVLKDGGAFLGPERMPCLATILARSLMEYKTWAWRTKAKRAFIGIGWIATAIARAKAPKIKISPVSLHYMDMTYLLRTKFIQRHGGDTFAYSFYATPSTQARVLLPNNDLTRISTLQNVVFLPPQEFYLDHVREDYPATGHVREDSPATGHVHEEYPATIQGTGRYDFNPYSGPMNTEAATTSAHDRINLLQRKTKWQQRTIEKMAKAMKGMKKTIKRMARTIDEMSCKNRDGQPPEPMESEPTTSRPSRADKGKRKARTPSPSSSNEPLSLDTEASSSPYQSD